MRYGEERKSEEGMWRRKEEKALYERKRTM